MRIYRCSEALIQQAAAKVGVCADVYPSRGTALGVKLWPSREKPFTVAGAPRTRHRLSLATRRLLEEIWNEIGPRGSLEISIWNLAPDAWREMVGISDTDLLFLKHIAKGIMGTQYISKKKISKYQRQQHGSQRAIAAVCWHGFRDFFRELFKLQPNASIHTARASYLGSEDFERKFEGTRISKNDGLDYSKLCWCADLQGDF